MARTSKVVQMPTQHQARIDTLLRRYHYACFDTVREQLAAEGIEIARSSLHRYAKRLEATDSLSANGPDSTVIVVMDLRNGTATQIRTSATPAAVIAAISDLDPPDLDVSEVPSA